MLKNVTTSYNHKGDTWTFKLGQIWNEIFLDEKKYFTWILALAIVCMITCGKTCIFLSRMIFLVHCVSNTMQCVSCTVQCVKFLRLVLRFKVKKIIYPKLLKTWNKFKMMNILFFQFLKFIRAGRLD